MISGYPTSTSFLEVDCRSTDPRVLGRHKKGLGKTKFKSEGQVTYREGTVASHNTPLSRDGKIGPARWASPVHPKLGSGWAIKFLARKKPGQIWPGPVWPSPVWPGPARPARIFFALK